MPTEPSSAAPTDDGDPAAGRHRWYDPLLAAARDLEHLTSAYHAELLGSTLLGSVRAVVGAGGAGTGASVETFVAGFREHLLAQADHSGPAGLLRAVLDALLPPPHPAGPDATPTAPPWVPLLGTATVTGTDAYGDGYGDQINYLITCAYPDADLGGPEHVVSVLVDNNLGRVKNLFVAAPAAVVLDQLRASLTADDGSYLVPVDPATLRAAVDTAMAATDPATDGDDDSSAADRAITVARLRLLPLPQGPDRPAGDRPDLAGAFRDSPEAERLVGAPGDAPSLAFCLELIDRFAGTRIDADPLRWSPAAARWFLLDWLPRHAVLDATDRALLPRVLDAWIRWSGRVRGLEPAMVAATVVEAARLRPEFVAQTRSGALRTPQAQAVAGMLAEGVDPDDPQAAAAWLAGHQPDTT